MLYLCQIALFIVILIVICTLDIFSMLDWLGADQRFPSHLQRVEVENGISIYNLTERLFLFQEFRFGHG